jgi:hypothetical protein
MQRTKAVPVQMNPYLRRRSFKSFLNASIRFGFVGTSVVLNPLRQAHERNFHPISLTTISSARHFLRSVAFGMRQSGPTDVASVLHCEQTAAVACACDPTATR